MNIPSTIKETGGEYSIKATQAASILPYDSGISFTNLETLQEQAIIQKTTRSTRDI